ncbi:winged helix-turn-helix transcriptional regulator [Candidatus Gracilibacteria bacterium]|nr:winged helix-turn-helix transcriptional regulator [Candidatus Gracilibacteria bacterium]
MQKDIHHLINLFFRMGRLIHETISKNHRVDPVTMQRMRCLKFISEVGKPTMKEIADFMCVTPPSTTALINSLVKSKHIKRVTDTGDRRIIRLSLTPTGSRALEAGFKKFTTHLERILGKLNETEQAQLAEILEKLTL